MFSFNVVVLNDFLLVIHTPCKKSGISGFLQRYRKHGCVCAVMIPHQDGIQPVVASMQQRL